jgi:transcriptional regulator with XRE-family HTH domain
MSRFGNNFAVLSELSYRGTGPGFGGALVRPSSILFGENLSLWLQRRKLKQVELARFVGVSEAAVSRWVDGRSLPTCETLDKISLALEIPVSALFRDATDSRLVDHPQTIEEALKLIAETVKSKSK